MKNGKKGVAACDLTQRPPRRGYVRLGGYVILPRWLDKALAASAGQSGTNTMVPKA